MSDQKLTMEAFLDKTIGRFDYVEIDREDVVLTQRAKDHIQEGAKRMEQEGIYKKADVLKAVSMAKTFVCVPGKNMGPILALAFEVGEGFQMILFPKKEWRYANTD